MRFAIAKIRRLGMLGKRILFPGSIARILKGRE
jgi:hypothetical protein